MAASDVLAAHTAQATRATQSTFPVIVRRSSPTVNEARRRCDATISGAVAADGDVAGIDDGAGVSPSLFQTGPPDPRYRWPALATTTDVANRMIEGRTAVEDQRRGGGNQAPPTRLVRPDQEAHDDT